MPDEMLRTVEQVTGALPKEWRAALEAVPRPHFLPDVVWLRGESGVHEPCDRRTEPERWAQAAQADRPVVIQVRDGDGQEAHGEDPWPGSSASQPSVVAAMLLDLDLDDGMRVLEIGTGTGWNAALLAHRLGGGNVTTVEVDAGLVEAARERLSALGLLPALIAGDGADGYAPGGPYDRIVATCSVSSVPRAWVEQSAPGGRIVAPWVTAWTRYGTALLRARDDGSASGLFRPGGAFMPMRAHRSKVDDIADVFSEEDAPQRTVTTVSPWAVAGGDDTEADFAIGLRLRDVWHHWDNAPGIDGVRTRLWVGDEGATSWASVDFDGHQLGTFAVRQQGPRRVWDEVEAAWAWWTGQGSPQPDRFGVTVKPNGDHRFWLDHEDGDSWTL